MLIEAPAYSDGRGDTEARTPQGRSTWRRWVLSHDFAQGLTRPEPPTGKGSTARFSMCAYAAAWAEHVIATPAREVSGIATSICGRVPRREGSARNEWAGHPRRSIVEPRRKTLKKQPLGAPRPHDQKWEGRCWVSLLLRRRTPDISAAIAAHRTASLTIMARTTSVLWKYGGGPRLDKASQPDTGRGFFLGSRWRAWMRWHMPGGGQAVGRLISKTDQTKTASAPANVYPWPARPHVRARLAISRISRHPPKRSRNAMASSVSGHEVFTGSRHRGERDDQPKRVARCTRFRVLRHGDLRRSMSGEIYLAGFLPIRRVRELGRRINVAMAWSEEQRGHVNDALEFSSQQSPRPSRRPSTSR
jgi:hypothetical protein